MTQAPKNTRRDPRRLIDDDHAVEALTQEAHAAVDLTQPALAIGVFGVLGAIALGRRIGDRLRHQRPLVPPQLSSSARSRARAVGVMYFEAGGAACAGIVP